MSNVLGKKLIRIVNGKPVIASDNLIVVRDTEELEAALSTFIPSNLIVPFALLEKMSVVLSAKINAVWISPDDDFESSTAWLEGMKTIAVDFPSFRDGRGYSIGYLLRKRYNWTGELRAIGDVLRDQINYMRRCGFDVFALRADKDIEAALKSFNHYSVHYQAGVDEPLPLFRRRGL